MIKKKQNKMQTNHFLRWCMAYHHYIDPWYDKFVDLFESHRLVAPTKKDFYLYCYINTRKTWDPKEKRSVPPIVLTPLKEESLDYQ